MDAASPRSEPGRYLPQLVDRIDSSKLSLFLAFPAGLSLAQKPDQSLRSGIAAAPYCEELRIFGLVFPTRPMPIEEEPSA
jgi:hypothetical protein